LLLNEQLLGNKRYGVRNPHVGSSGERHTYRGAWVVSWWIANTYTDSHVRSVLRSVGIGSGGTRVVSGSTYKAMGFWLPLLAAAVCAYLGERVVGYYRTRVAASAEGREPSHPSPSPRSGSG
jgi:hypothetical protein